MAIQSGCPIDKIYDVPLCDVIIGLEVKRDQMIYEAQLTAVAFNSPKNLPKIPKAKKQQSTQDMKSVFNSIPATLKKA